LILGLRINGRGEKESKGCKEKVENGQGGKGAEVDKERGNAINDRKVT